jgi:outer membrane receptor protein involved in Fe transport
MRCRLAILVVFLCLGGVWANATIFGNVRGIVHDPQHRPIPGAVVMLRSSTSAWQRTARSNADGEFEFGAVPLGEYSISAAHPGFQRAEEKLTVTSGSSPILHLMLAVAGVSQEVTVSGTPATVNPESSTTETLLSRKMIAQTPGADRSNSFAMITDYVPSAVMVHDQLHVRGGHQVSWLVDGVEVPNTNIADTVGPQFDPRDIDYFEIQRGGYAAEYGDRTYAVFNIVPRSGFSRNREGELNLNYGSRNATDDYLSFGSHTDRFAYHASVHGNRTDLGLATPSETVLHDLNSGAGGFVSLIFNATPSDQLRLVSSLREDHYQVPNTPEQQAAGIRDLDLERDAFVNFSWVHTFGPGLLLTFSPFYHFNRAHYLGGPSDTPLIPDSNRASQYFGGETSLRVVAGRHNAAIGLAAFGQHDDTLFALTAAGESSLSLRQQSTPTGNDEAVFVQDQYRMTSWLTWSGGIRFTHYAGELSETSTDPRLGVAIRLPKLGWVLRGFYGRAYQPPPLETVSGPLLAFALQEGFGFLPLRGERDELYEIGLAVPLRGWTLDTDYYHSRARNFFDHDVLGNSNIFLPLTIAQARLRGWEATLRSPELFGRARLHLAYAHSFAEGRGGVTGGLTDFSPPENAYFFLDHDQRDTVAGVFTLRLPWQSWMSGSLAYGSGFLNGDGPGHLPPHATFDLSFEKQIGESWSIRANALNVTNVRYLLDNSNTFGGTHYDAPRELSLGVRYHFHF